MPWTCRRCHRFYADEPAGGRCPHDACGGTMLAVADRTVGDEHTGRVCDEKYRVGRLIGRGGMGCVHEAVNLRIEQPVAIKFFSPRAGASHDGGAAAAERFRREAVVTVRLRHPNVVEVIDFSVEPDGTQYIVTELLEGSPLDAALAAGGLTVGRALEIVSSVLRAIEYAHSQDVIHRDLKPSNVFLAQMGGREAVKVLDFGIARIGGMETITQGPLGTWRYAAPEQLAGNPDLAGRVVVRWTITPGGGVESAEATSNTTGDDGMARCVVDAVRQMHFPESGSPASIVYPFVFTPAGAASGG